MTNEITIQPIKTELSGDWHDKPLRYAVNGPSAEVQKFSTKKDAMKYASKRRRTVTQAEAINWYVRQ